VTDTFSLSHIESDTQRDTHRQRQTDAIKQTCILYKDVTKSLKYQVRGQTVFLSFKRMAMEDTLFLVLYWTGPIGLGIFFAGLGYCITCLAKVARKEKAKDTKG